MKHLSIIIILILAIGLTLPVYADAPQQYIEWANKAEIKEWVKSTGIPDREYIPELYDCDDFAIDLMLAGLRDGRLIGLVIAYEARMNYYHLNNFTIIGNEVIRIDAWRGWYNTLCHLDIGGASKDIWGTLHDFYNPKNF